MKKFEVVLTILLFCRFFNSAVGDYTGSELWRITPQTGAELSLVRDIANSNQQIDFWSDLTRLNTGINILIPPHEVENIASMLSQNDISYKVVTPNIQAVIDKQFEANRQAKRKQRSNQRVVTIETFDYSVYKTAEEIYEWMNLIEVKYDFINKLQVGITYEGRKIYALEIKKPSSGKEKPVIYIDALIHCREWITTATMIKVFHNMLTDPTKAWMTEDLDWLFIPMINVDGYVHTWTEGGRLWRKTRSTGPSSSAPDSLCVGTDANRNWNDHWSGPGSSPNPCTWVYHGPTAASESEVRHLQNYILDNKDDIKGMLSIHSASQLILYPFNYDYNLPPDNDKLNRTAKLMHEAILSVHNKTYVYGPGAETIYQCSGVTSDWTYNKANIIMSYTYELRDTGEFGFLLPADQIIPSSEEITAAVEAFAHSIKDDI